MSFVHLHVHSYYSVLDGFSSPEALVDEAIKYDMSALALTDHGTMFGILDFYRQARAKKIKPILGLETYVASRRMQDKSGGVDLKSFHLLLLAENMQGYQNLLKIASVAQLEGFYSHPRIDHDYLASHSAGLIAASACLSGEIPRALLSDNYAQAESTLTWYQDVFGKENFFLELQEHDLPEQTYVNRGLLDLAKRHQAPLIATNDVHYCKKSDAQYQEILLCMQTNAKLSEPNRMRMNNDSYYLRSPEEMARIFSETPEALRNTVAIAERCNVVFNEGEYHLPKFAPPSGESSQSFLLKLCQEGLQRRIPDRVDSDPVQERLSSELGIIHTMGFDDYFLIVWDLCRYSREKNIWYNVRGSGNGSLVAFALDITSVEPLSYQLLFERFLNPSRHTMPDIDLDFQDDRRTEVMEYCNQKYGADKVAQIVTFGTLGGRGAVRDVGRVLGFQPAETARISKLVPPPAGGKESNLSDVVKKTPELAQAVNESDRIRELIDIAGHMQGCLRNVGTHAAGVIISDEALTNYLPLHRPTGQNADNVEEVPIRSVAQYDMEGINYLGLLKVDFLGLITLTILARACDLIEKRHGRKMGLDNIPIDDPEVYRYIGEGHTAGLFQLEGAGMTGKLMAMKPQNINHVIAMVALYRPGPMQFIPRYIASMRGEMPVTYQHEKLKPILEETYGVAVYQEQVMQAAMSLASYSASEADELRAAISKKKSNEIDKHHELFVDRACENGIPRSTAEAIFANWEGFAQYGFNKGHASNYGMMAVKTGYIKLHYPAEYMTALLSASKNEAVKCAMYIGECRTMGLDVFPPSVNFSDYDFSIEERPGKKTAIRFGLGAIKNVGQSPSEAIMRARDSKPFADINDFIYRVDLREVGKRPLEFLIKAGALDCFGATRGALLRSIEGMYNLSSVRFESSQHGQMNLFGDTLTSEGGGFVLPTNVPANPREEQAWEKELLGLYITDHPLHRYSEELKKKTDHSATELKDCEDQEPVCVGGLVKSIRLVTTKNQEAMAFVTLEDFTGDIDLVFFPRSWERYNNRVKEDTLLIIRGKAQHRDESVNVLVDTLAMDKKLMDQIDYGDDDAGLSDRLLDRYLPDMELLSAYGLGASPERRVADNPQTYSIWEGNSYLPAFDNSVCADDSEEDGFEDGGSDFFEEDIIPDNSGSCSAFFDATPLPVAGDAEDLSVSTAPENIPFVTPVIKAETEEDLTSVESPAKPIACPVPAVNAGRAEQHLQIKFAYLGDHDRSWRHIQNVYAWLNARPGEQEVSFLVPTSKENEVKELDFPNLRVDLSDSVLIELRGWLGEENVRVFPLVGGQAQPF